jgi:hypothetical protein
MKGSKSNLKAYAKEEKGAKYRVVDDWGAARILSVTDVSDRTGAWSAGLALFLRVLH